MVPFLVKAGLQGAERLGRGARAHALVGVDQQRVALALGDLDRDDLLGQAALLGGRRGLLVARRRERVLALAGDADLLVVLLGGEAHGDVVEGVGQAVVHHGVDQGGVADPEAGPGAGQQVGRLCHGLHAAGHDDLGVTGADHLVGQVDGVEAREADLVDGVGRDRHRDAALHRGLAGRDLALAGQDHLAHEHVVDLVGRHAGPPQRLGDGEAAQVHGREPRQRARQLPDGGPSPCDDDGLSHACTSGSRRSGYRSETTSYGPTIVGSHERHPQCCVGRCARR